MNIDSHLKEAVIYIGSAHVCRFGLLVSFWYPHRPNIAKSLCSVFLIVLGGK